VINGLLQKLPTLFLKDRRPRDTKTQKAWLPLILIASLGASALVWGMRELKWLQSWELSAYDQMLRSRPAEPLDKRILLVTITQNDIQRYGWPPSDRTINQLLKKLESDEPRVIGLGIFRDLPQEPGNQELIANLQRQHNIIGLCEFSSLGKQEVPPPPNIPQERLGFSDLISDESDRLVRRSLLLADSDDKKCKTENSFAAQLALSYLKKQGIKLKRKGESDFQLGKTYLQHLTSNSGSYEHLDEGGYQILLNYRHPKSLAREVTLTQVIEDKIDASLVKDRLVIIGTTANSINPGFYTPYGALLDQPPRMAPVLIHTQLASQIISGALDGRSQIWYWTDWLEDFWLLCWSLMGSILAWRLRHPLMLVMVASITLCGLVSICMVLLLQAGWIPVIPPGLGLIVAGLTVRAYTNYQTQQYTKVIILQVKQQEEAIAELNILLEESTAIGDMHRHQAGAIDIPVRKTGDSVLGGRYQITRVLGSGGFGCTYLAKDTQRPGNPICVVKQLMPARRDTKFLQVARRLFNTEAEILEILGKHHQIPELLAYFEENQEFYLIQEYIQGHLLSEELPPIQGVQKESDVIDMLKGILEILVFVHEHRVIHRDIKPTNIIRSSPDNRLVLIDFGAVKLMQPVNREETELATVAIGTRGYAPPEQFAGHPRLCSDIYALGMIGIQALTGIPPQELKPDPETGNVMWRQRVQIVPEFAAILDKMVRYHFSDRYQSADEVLQDLKSIT
jgi:CHASE2 domain-containing sensor protein/predicted Ser/Thr protein kinase